MMKPEKKEIRITIRLEESIKVELELLANKADRKLADYIRVKLKEVVSNEKNQSKKQ